MSFKNRRDDDEDENSIISATHVASRCKMKKIIVLVLTCALLCFLGATFILKFDFHNLPFFTSSSSSSPRAQTGSNSTAELSATRLLTIEAAAAAAVAYTPSLKTTTSITTTTTTPATNDDTDDVYVEELTYYSVTEPGQITNYNEEE